MADERVRHQLEMIQQHLLLLRESIAPQPQHDQAVRRQLSALTTAVGELGALLAVNEDPALDEGRPQPDDALRREQRRMFLTLVRNMPGLVYRCLNDPTWTVLFVSEGSVQLLGYQPDQLLGSRDVAYGDLIHPDDRAAVWSSVQEALAEGRPFKLSYRVRTAEGAEKWVLEQGQAVLLESGEQVIEGFITDITEQKHAEEQLQAREQLFSTLVQNSSDIFTITDVEGILRYVSPSVEPILGYAPQELLGQHTFVFVHPDDQERLTQTLAETASDPHGVSLTTFRYRHKDGSWRVLESFGSNQIAHPAVRGIVGNSRDVSERIQLEAQIQQAQKLESVGRLAAGIAHDFNNVLTVITGFAEMVYSSLSSEEVARGDVEQIMLAAERGSMLTQQLLTFARKRVVAAQLLDLNTLVVEMEPLLRRLTGPSIAVRLHQSRNLALVKADRIQLEQVLMNLVVNAVDAMPEGGELVIETLNCPSRHAALAVGMPAVPCVRLVVRDTGAGIPPEIQQQIFEPFFTTKDAGHGTGLGLAISYGIVKEHGGTIVVESRPGKGSAFDIYLPQARAEPEPAQLTAAAPALGRGSGQLLLVEDEESLRALLARILRSSGYEVIEAANGREALSLFAVEAAPDLLLTDIMMPEMSGQELVARVRAEHPSLKVLLISAYAADLTGLLDEHTRFLQKPFTPAVLLRAVREILGG